MKKTVTKFWSVNEYHEEEKWLNEMAAEGWNLVKTGVVKFEFESGKPNEYIYRLELLDKDASSKESQNYINFLEETGIEKVGECNNWVYLRKKTSEGPFAPANESLNGLSHEVRVLNVFEGIRATLLVICGITAIAGTVMNFIDAEASVFQFFMGFFEGITLALCVILAVTVPVFKSLRGNITKAVKEMALHQ